ncbi:MAG: acetyl-CoA carboxylase biotin carboxylase subunit [Deltaproteobacteria bacterium]|nr:acetyl-CoA carboxylase biotin carboxylase subunit [Deltaproteobacteria bacterium]
MFSKVLVANRGEIAIRIIRALKELGIRSVAVYSTADERALHTRLADEKICIGPAQSKGSYLNAPAIISAAQIKGADAIHPGYGFLSEDAGFAEVCEQAGLKFIGPKPQDIELMGNKLKAREYVDGLGIQVLPGTFQEIEDEQHAIRTAKDIGLPLIVKAAEGGGGRGMKIIYDEDQIPNIIKIARTEAKSAFGNASLYIEKYFEYVRHIEIQLVGDGSGGVVALGERECSIQRRHQKFIEEAPSIAVDDKLRNRMSDTAVKIARHISYRGPGTIEFLLDEKGKFYFMEMNTRLQVEHPVTELVTGLDIVAEQIRIASGEKMSLSQRDVRIRGHAIECRINAEDPQTLVPSSGKIDTYVQPGGPWVRVDGHAYPGYEVPPYYDSLVAKLIVWAEDRDRSIRRMQRALDEFVIEGIKTNIPLHRKILASKDFLLGNITTRFIDKFI